MGITSMILGIMSLFLWLFPYFGFPASIAGLIVGLFGRKTSNKGMATAGIVMSSIGLAFSFIWLMLLLLLISVPFWTV